MPITGGLCFNDVGVVEISNLEEIRSSLAIPFDATVIYPLQEPVLQILERAGTPIQDVPERRDWPEIICRLNKAILKSNILF